MKNLIDHCNYFRLNPTKNNWIQFFDYLINCDPIEIIEIKKFMLENPTNIQDEKQLISNTKKKYSFSPFFIVNEVEKYLRFTSHGKIPSTVFYIHDSLKIFNEDIIFEEQIIHNIKYYTIYISDIWANFKKLAKFISNHASDESCIFTRPHNIWQMIANNDFIKLIETKIKSIINTDCELFFENKFKQNNIKLIDQMINWKSGINFFTCNQGKIHFLPLFIENKYSYKNILNTSDHEVIIDDHFKFQNTHKYCMCGRKLYKIEFIPHYKNYPKFNHNYIFNQLQSKFRSFQIIQNEKSINIFYKISKNENILDQDKEILNFEFKNFNIEYFPNEVFYVGSKMPYLWKKENTKIF